MKVQMLCQVTNDCDVQEQLDYVQFALHLKEGL